MKPVTRRKPRERSTMWGWDVEASDPDGPWDHPTLVVAKSEHGDREVFPGASCVDRTATLMQRTGGDWLAHYGGGYDVPLMLNYWRPRRLVLSGSTILCADGGFVRSATAKRGVPLKLRDSYPWWLCPLAKAGKAVGLEKFDVDRAAMERLTPQELVPYCERDVDIEIAAAKECRKFLDDHGVEGEPWTAGSSAAGLVKALEPGTWNALKRNKANVDDIMEVLQSGAARGGTVTCNARGIVENVYVYDRKSAYPAAYAFDDIGIGLRRATADELGKPSTFEGVALCRWRWTDRRRVPPALDQFTQCGVGECKSWLTGEEIKRFLALGVKLTLDEGWCPNEILPVAQTFAAIMFAAKESGGAASFFAKVFVNAWSGKTGMSPLQEQFTAWGPSKYWGPNAPITVPEGDGPRSAWWYRYLTLSHDKDLLCATYQQPMISIMTFGRARAALWDIDDAVYAAGWPVLYNDTDAIFTTCPPEKMPVPLGTGLGQLAFEGGPYRGYFLGPKAYCLVDPSTSQVKKCALKGIPHRSYADGIVALDEQGREYFREARGPERVRGRGAFSRKGSGRDMRLALFERALRDEVKGSRCEKDGLSTFLRGLAGTDDEGPGVWKRAPVTRTVRPSGRGKIFLGPSVFEYLSIVEVTAARMLQTLPMREASARKRFTDSCVDYAIARGLVEVKGPTLDAAYASRAWLQALGPQWSESDHKSEANEVNRDEPEDVHPV